MTGCQLESFGECGRVVATATERPEESPLQLALLKAWKESLAKQSNHEQIQDAVAGEL